MHLQGREACTFSAKTTHGESHLWRKPLMAPPPLRATRHFARPKEATARTHLVREPLWFHGADGRALDPKHLATKRQRIAGSVGAWRRVRLVRGEGRGVSTLYEGWGRGGLACGIHSGGGRSSSCTCEGRGVSG